MDKNEEINPSMMLSEHARPETADLIKLACERIDKVLDNTIDLMDTPEQVMILFNSLVHFAVGRHFLWSTIHVKITSEPDKYVGAVHALMAKAIFNTIKTAHEDPELKSEIAKKLGPKWGFIKKETCNDQ